MRDVRRWRCSVTASFGSWPTGSCRRAIRGALVRALAGVDHAGPDGRRVVVSAPTLRRWLRAWRAGGFEALAPAVRDQPTRTAVEVLAAAESLKREAPRRTAAQVARALSEAGGGHGECPHRAASLRPRGVAYRPRWGAAAGVGPVREDPVR